ncbi:hypothetical protein HAX54_035123, partial [Datura stramonium]|nr:hypothetical protein [Datura stramonium]
MLGWPTNHSMLLRVLASDHNMELASASLRECATGPYDHESWYDVMNHSVNHGIGLEIEQIGPNDHGRSLPAVVRPNVSDDESSSLATVSSPFFLRMWYEWYLGGIGWRFRGLTREEFVITGLRRIHRSL